MSFFYDTSASLLLLNRLFEMNERFYISDCTIKELEMIKSSATKDEKTKANARKLIKLLVENEKKYDIIRFNNETYRGFIDYYEVSNNNSMDSKILSCIYSLILEGEEVTLVTCDLCQYYIAKNCGIGSIFLSSPEDEEDEYKGYIEMDLVSEETATQIYEDIEANDNSGLDLLENEYLILNLKYNECGGQEVFKWKDGQYSRIKYPVFESDHFGTIKPSNVYQMLAMDSMKNNDITLIGGPAGSGKTYLSLGFLFDQLEKNLINKIVIFCNPVVAKNAARLGFYPGTQLEKILSSQVGNVLSSKIGLIEVEKLIQRDYLDIIPAGDSRGYEVPSNCGVYIMEAQNLDTVLLRMLLQRIGANCKVIVDGDRREQTDLEIYENDNGMKKMSKVFRGESIYGQADLQKIERSRIAELAERMK